MSDAEATPRPGAEHRRLGILVGTWNTEGRTIEGPFGPATSIEGTDSYEWLPGEFFLIHRVDVRMGQQRAQAIEIFGYDESKGTYTTHSFDSQGNTATYEATVRDRVWTIVGDSERATLVADGSGEVMTARWEKRNDASEWLPWMDVKLSRAV